MEVLLHTWQRELQSWVMLDWFIAASLAFSTCAAFLKGFIASLISLLGMCAGVFAAIVYAPRESRLLLGWISSPLIARIAAYLLVLAAVYFGIALVGRLLRGICRAIGLGFFDRIAGAAFGLLRGTLLLASLALPLEPYLVHSFEGRSSRLLPYFLQVSHGISSVVPQHMRGALSAGHIGL